MKNLLWLILEKGYYLFVSLFSNLLIARYLGVSDFGLISLSMAIISVFNPLVYLGLNSIVVKELVEKPALKDSILCTVFLMKLSASLFVLMLGFLLLPLVYEKEVVSILNILMFSLVFDTFLIISFFFISKEQSKYYTYSSMIAYTLGFVFKVCVIWLDKGLTFLIYGMILQNILLSLSLFCFYSFRERFYFFSKFKLSLALKFIKKSWPLALSSLVAVIYLKMDQIMIGVFLNEAQLGLYSSAVKISEVWYILPTVAATAFLPRLVNYKKVSQNKYNNIKFDLYRASFYLAIVISFIVYYFSNEIIVSLYGVEFSSASHVLLIHIWACPFVYLGAIFSKVLIVEGQVKFTLVRDLGGALLNIFLNYLFIPKFGIEGAAMATVVSYFFCFIILPFLWGRTYSLAKEMILALNPFLFLLDSDK